MTFPTPQKEAYAISIFRTCRDMLDIKGSGEHRSIQGLEYAMIWDTVSPGVNGVSTGVRGGIMGAGGRPLFEAWSEVSKEVSSERWEEMRVRTLEWK